MLKIGFTEVKQALAGHGAVLDTFFFWYQVQHRVHQRRFARRAAALDQDG
ncbi:hypothetical protein Xsze_04379 [Xenorhabdus szentirmaii DSM 16338]|nr:hypothetical protein Xsze_04379 [Xenorhabdus szentirmaii DSM 16338]